MYQRGKTAALATLGLEKYAGYFDRFPEAARRMARNHAIGGALAGGALGAGVGVLSNHDGDTIDKALGGTVSGLMLGGAGYGIGGIHGLSKGLGQGGLRIGNRARASALTGVVTGGLGGLMNSDRDNMGVNILGGAALGGALGGATGAAFDTFAEIDPHMMQFMDAAMNARHGGY